MLMYCSGPQKMDVLKTFSRSNELRIIFLTLQIWFFLIKIILIFFLFFTEKVWKLFGTILMKIFCSFFFNNIDKSEPEVNFHWKLCYTHAN